MPEATDTPGRLAYRLHIKKPLPIAISAVIGDVVHNLRAVRELAADPRVYQTVLTGNLRQVAAVKLAVFWLDRHLDLEAGAYGDDDSERPKLVAIAQGRAAQRTGVTFGNDATVLIGDTPKDVEAGLAAEVRVIGVATGKSSMAELRAAGAEAVVRDLAECRGVIEGL